MSRPRLTDLDFELVYLAHLTKYGLKPLSRWERELSPKQCELLRGVVPEVESIRRGARHARRATEVVFSTSARATNLYRQRFDGKPIDHSPRMTRLEGRIFGYPSCCVEAFVRDPYATNSLSREDQEILFHWACPECNVTPPLLREYRRVHHECSRLFRGHPKRGPAWRGILPGSAARVAASLALAAGVATTSSARGDPHWLDIADDLDHDYLSVAEEILAGTDWENPDTDQNSVLDGVQTAQLISSLLSSPPSGVVLTHHPMRGMEQCTRCALNTNMGHVKVSHPQRGLSVDLPYIVLHYLEHGSLAYEGDIHAGRVDYDTLKRILLPCDPGHLVDLWWMEDSDDDRLYDVEEIVLDTDPQNPDSDGDSLLDGPQVAEELLSLISRLPRHEVTDGPYLLEGRMDGLVQCGVCGVSVNMGHTTIVNPLAECSIDVPFLSLHAQAHGSSDYVVAGDDQHRTLPTVLRSVLTATGPAHWMPVAGDSDGDGLTDEEDLYFGFDPNDPDVNGNGRPDGRELAMILAEQIRRLPTEPRPDLPWAEWLWLLGSEGCYTCGDRWTMGQVRITYPAEGLVLDVPFYNLHFMEHGSFSTDGLGFERLDPIALAQVLGPYAVGIESSSPAPTFAFWNAPNPFPSGGSTWIELALPTTHANVEVVVYDVAGRKVRDLHAGPISGSVLKLRWDGRDDRGRSAAAGVYYCKVRAGDTTVARKLTIAP
jgi:hypothetical protein